MAHSYSSLTKLRSLFLLGLGLSAAPAALAQTAPTPIAISSATAVYTQNFDGMGATGTMYPTGWTGLRLSGSGTANDFLSPTVFTASSNSGAVYNAGPETGASTTDRALGSIASSSTAPAFGAIFSNQTGAAITQVNIAARLEQWRSGNNAVNEITAFEYSLNATSLSTGTWVAVTSLDLTERNTSSTTAELTDGNSATNSAPIAGTITLNWPASTTMWIRWKDTDNTGNDALMAVDNFAISTGATPLSTRTFTKNSGTVSIFPNPATDVVSVRVNGQSLQAPVVVTDLTGRTVLRGSVTADGTFSLRGLPSGSYLMLVENGQTTSTYKVVKQ